MAIKISIKNQLPLDVLESEIKNLNMKRSLSGQIMVFNHIDMDIVLDEKAGKVTADVSKKLQAEIDKLLKAAQNSGPVKNFDQQFEILKSQLKMTSKKT